MTLPLLEHLYVYPNLVPQQQVVALNNNISRGRGNISLDTIRGDSSGQQENGIYFLSLPLSRFVPQCRVWSYSARTWTHGDTCQVANFSRQSITCSCKSGGIIAGFIFLTSPPPLQGPPPTDSLLDRGKTKIPDFLANDQKTLLVIFIILAVIFLLIAMFLVYWKQKHLTSSEDELAILYSRWQKEVAAYKAKQREKDKPREQPMEDLDLEEDTPEEEEEAEEEKLAEGKPRSCVCSEEKNACGIFSARISCVFF